MILKTDKFEIIELKDGYRLIISNDSDGFSTIGLKCKRGELYELFSLLRNIFSSEEE